MRYRAAEAGEFTIYDPGGWARVRLGRSSVAQAHPAGPVGWRRLNLMTTMSRFVASHMPATWESTA
jgi:hypothetical protein